MKENYGWFAVNHPVSVHCDEFVNARRSFDPTFALSVVDLELCELRCGGVNCAIVV